MKKVTVIIILTIISNSVTGQSLNGKWILKDIVSVNGIKGYPGFQLLEINGDKVDFYTDFSLKEKASTWKMERGYLLNYNNEKTSGYQIVDENHIKLFVNGKSNGRDTIFESDFYRLNPTITNLKKEDIEKLIFVLNENGRESELAFNKELWDKESLELLRRKEGEKKGLNKLILHFLYQYTPMGKEMFLMLSKRFQLNC
ncbi:hypothetical protein [uncultured Aquimarina sp.]|uniref:hypothetical protein n=1 Tax=uncultured Aquimarina sp. TaxID=575652 RepID=UPI00261F7F34|nr:hypothetical protein [uncultured Aquimarina sp.]